MRGSRQVSSASTALRAVVAAQPVTRTARYAVQALDLRGHRTDIGASGRSGAPDRSSAVARGGPRDVRQPRIRRARESVGALALRAVGGSSSSHSKMRNARERCNPIDVWIRGRGPRLSRCPVGDARIDATRTPASARWRASRRECKHRIGARATHGARRATSKHLGGENLAVRGILRIDVVKSELDSRRRPPVLPASGNVRSERRTVPRLLPLQRQLREVIEPCSRRIA